MAELTFTGNAVAVAQVSKITPASVTIDDLFNVTINGKTITYTATGSTVASVVTGMVALLSVSTIPEFAEITWTDAATWVLATGTTAGVPFTVTSSASGTTPPTLVTASITSASGPTFWSTAANWSDGAVPTASDNVTLDGAWIISDGFAQSPVALPVFTILPSFSGQLGRPTLNPLGYTEYRALELAISATAFNMPDGAGQGSRLVRINFGTIQNASTIRKTGQALVDGQNALMIRGTNTSNTVDQSGGDIGYAIGAGQTSALATLSRSGGTFVWGPTSGLSSCAITDGSSSGDLTLNASAASLVKTGSSSVIQNAGVIAAVTVTNGTYKILSSGTWAAITASESGAIDASGDTTTKTFTVLNCYDGCTVRGPHGNIAVGTLNANGNLTRMILDFGFNRVLTVA